MSKGYMCDKCRTFAAGQSNQHDGEWHPKGWAEVRIPEVRHLCAACVGELELATRPNRASNDKAGQ